jgi:hypothetical protein
LTVPQDASQIVSTSVSVGPNIASQKRTVVEAKRERVLTHILCGVSVVRGLLILPSRNVCLNSNFS